MICDALTMYRHRDAFEASRAVSRKNRSDPFSERSEIRKKRARQCADLHARRP
jgi:hypothetical protein